MNRSCIRSRFLCGAALVALAASANAQVSGNAQANGYVQANGNARKGEDVFTTNCGECHSAREGRDKRGPSLYGMVGATAGQKAGFKYSDDLAASGIVWDAENLSRYLANPRALVPGSKMKFDGLANAQERADVIAYIATLGAH